MGAPLVQKLEHAELRVTDLSRAVEFYTEIVGLTEIGRDSGVVYLSCGLNQNYDLALREGGTGVEHFAVRVDDEEQFTALERRLKEHGVTCARADGTEPGQDRAIRFRLPSGHQMELAMVRDRRYLNPSEPVYRRTRGFGPLDADHINLMATDVTAASEFLHRVLGFRFSDITEPRPGFRTAAWQRLGDYHHDVAWFRTESASESLHHMAWALSGMEHMKVASDLLAQAGVRLELGPSRHPIGSNLFIYFWDPVGNRVELSAEGAVLDKNSPPRTWQGFENTLDAWGTLHERIPASFLRGS